MHKKYVSFTLFLNVYLMTIIILGCMLICIYVIIKIIPIDLQKNRVIFIFNKTVDYYKKRFNKNHT